MMRNKIEIKVLFFVIVVESYRLQSGVLGFSFKDHASSLSTAISPNNKVVCWSAPTKNPYCFPDSPPTVQNPITKRKIHLGGPTFNDFLKQGMWVQHEGTLQRLDLEALREYQQSSSLTATGQSDVKDISPYREGSNQEISMHEWHCITPSVVLVGSKDENKSIATANSLETAEANLNLLGQQLVFVNKPSGLNCVPSRDLSIESLSSQVSLLYRNAKPCHRLDRDTSGLVLFGLTPDAHRDISKQFEARTTSKTYTALIAGHPIQEDGIVDMPIGKQKTIEGFNRWVIGGDKPREAVTTWRLDETFTDASTGAKFSRVELEPKTGRGHQLRLHMKAIGHPILGDTLHGEGGVASCSPRLCLHALKLRVDWNGLRLEAESVAPF